LSDGILPVEPRHIQVKNEHPVPEVRKMENSTVFLRKVVKGDPSSVEARLRECFDFEALVPAGSKVAVKVNLSTPFGENAEGSNTAPEILEAVCRILSERTDQIVVGESNGMRYNTLEAFEVSGYVPILKKFGISPTNFTEDEWVDVGEPLIKGWGLPRKLLEADVFVTLPVLKTHATTVFTGALKNQFGCYPQHNRILLHPHLDEVIVLINRVLKPRLAVMDAIVGMEGRGPINGVPRRMDMIVASTDPVALDSTAMRLVGLDPYTSEHVVLASKQGLGAIDEAGIFVDGDFEGLRTQFEPAEKDFPIRLLGYISHSKFLTEKLILNPEAFYPLRRVAVNFRSVRDHILGLFQAKRAS
jgi:uncharacterized protein (DUF362 family)